MLTLGIETSVRAGTVALCRDGEILVERSLSPEESAGRRRRHAQRLVPEMVECFRRCGLEPADCEAVAVSLGPGSFTGLRVGVVCAKTFAYATGSRAAGVDTFLAVAENGPPEVGELFVIGDAQRGDLFVGRYHRRPDGRFERIGEIAILNAENWCKNRSPADIVSGPGLEQTAGRLDGRCRILDSRFRIPRASVIARLGQRAVQAGRTDDAWALEPVYLRKSAAEEKWDERHDDSDKKQRPV